MNRPPAKKFVFDSSSRDKIINDDEKKSAIKFIEQNDLGSKLLFIDSPSFDQGSESSDVLQTPKLPGSNF